MDIRTYANLMFHGMTFFFIYLSFFHEFIFMGCFLAFLTFHAKFMEKKLSSVQACIMYRWSQQYPNTYVRIYHVQIVIALIPMYHVMYRQSQQYPNTYASCLDSDFPFPAVSQCTYHVMCRTFESLVTSWLQTALHYTPERRGGRRRVSEDAPCLSNMDHILATKVKSTQCGVLSLLFRLVLLCSYQIRRIYFGILGKGRSFFHHSTSRKRSPRLSQLTS